MKKRFNRFPQVQALVFSGAGSVAVKHVALVPRRKRQGRKVVKFLDRVNMTWHIPGEVQTRFAVVDRARGQQELILPLPGEKKQKVPKRVVVMNQKVSNLSRVRAYVVNRPDISSRELRTWAEVELGVSAHSARGIWSKIKKEGLVS